MHLEEAPSGRSACVGCGEKIKLGSQRLAVDIVRFGYTNYQYRCLRCALRYLREEIHELDSLIRKVKWLITKEKN